ncbi:hypothetical protein DC522_23735 [Microvirga sp. KLBC 81]|uniref:hypothetical protein n=1 Tax=Microvirga sp. KLBC 81 TaxID=1862707 RepID=UPI000D512E1F|nr:hypothetical protein [Microvirga sp. KLBC 81]PVE21949.1 hypothetical protein DC522_23735 [Microvirga sp. KLBC 81]
MIRERGDRGMSRYEMGQYCRQFKRLKMSEADEVIKRLESYHRVRFQAIKTESKPRKAWVYVG